MFFGFSKMTWLDDNSVPPLVLALQKRHELARVASIYKLNMHILLYTGVRNVLGAVLPQIRVSLS